MLDAALQRKTFALAARIVTLDNLRALARGDLGGVVSAIVSNDQPGGPRLELPRTSRSVEIRLAPSLRAGTMRRTHRSAWTASRPLGGHFEVAAKEAPRQKAGQTGK